MPRPTRSLLRRPHLTWRLTHPCAAYTDLEVWDTAELKQLESQMLEMEAGTGSWATENIKKNNFLEAEPRQRVTWPTWQNKPPGPPGEQLAWLNGPACHLERIDGKSGKILDVRKGRETENARLT